MSKTDRQTDKSSRWSFTAYEQQYGLLSDIPHEIAEWGWQDEVCPDTGRPHRQGYLRTKQQVRLSKLTKLLPGIHLEVARDWNKLVNYCKKSETAVPGTQVHTVNSNMRTIYSLAKEVANALPPLALLEEEFEDLRQQIRNKTTRGVEPNYGTYHLTNWEEYFLHRVDLEVKYVIKNGGTEAAFIACNPLWLCMWKKYGKEYLTGIKSNIEYNGKDSSAPP